jgi:MFS superfamily sulfate permease-like transporter
MTHAQVIFIITGFMWGVACMIFVFTQIDPLMAFIKKVIRKSLPKLATLERLSKDSIWR